MPSIKVNQSTLKKGVLSSRLHIRPFQLSDYESWKFIYQNMKTAQNPWDESPWQDRYLTKSEYKKFLTTVKDDWISDQIYQFGVFLRDTQELVGLIRVSGIQRGIFQNGYLGYRIFNLYWQNQFGTEAVSKFSPWFIKHGKLHRLEAGISIDNKSSLKMIKKTPFKKEGLSRSRLWVNGQWTDHWIYTLLSTD